jgi:hypothetical protein
MAGNSRIAPPLLLGKLYRLFGVDATVFPNHGGRFGYTPATCLALAEEARQPWAGLAACVPVSTGGMTTARVPEMLDFYGPDVMLLIGGNLLSGRSPDGGNRGFPERRRTLPAPALIMSDEDANIRRFQPDYNWNHVERMRVIYVAKNEVLRMAGARPAAGIGTERHPHLEPEA